MNPSGIHGYLTSGFLFRADIKDMCAFTAQMQKRCRANLLGCFDFVTLEIVNLFCMSYVIDV